MKSFLKKTILFLAIFFFICGLSLLINFLIIRNSNIFDLPEDKETLILGDSQTECSIDDSVFKSSLNLSSSASPYFYSYLKLKNILNNGENSIETVLLSFSYHNIFRPIDDRWLLNDKHIRSKAGRNGLFLMEWPDFYFLLKLKPIALFGSFPELIKSSFKNNIKYVFGDRKYEDLSLGRYKNPEEGDLAEAIKNFQNEENNNNYEISELESLYLKKIVELCRDNDIRLIFINTPKHKFLEESLPDKIGHFRSFYENNFSDVAFLDFYGYDLGDDYFNDLRHLNGEGALFFSEEIEKLGLDELIKLHFYKR